MHNELIRAAEFIRCYSLCTTQVGAALEAVDGSMRMGVNLEQRWHFGIHAEMAAIVAMVSVGQRRFVKMAIVCHREQFTPCGACIDWMMDYATPDAEIIVSDGETVTSFTLEQLMPYYPTQFSKATQQNKSTLHGETLLENNEANK